MFLLSVRKKKNQPVSQGRKKLPKDVIDHWPEVLKDVNIDVVPLEYLHSIRVSFVDGKVWDIDLRGKKTSNDLENVINELLLDYEDAITGVDFRLDTIKLKKDITKRTNQFLKKRK